MRDKFVLDSKKIMIYGAGFLGVNIYNICKEMGFTVLGFFDKRGEEIGELQGVKVYNIDSKEVDSIDKNIVVFVAVKNVFEHDNIASKLLAKGFHNIIYKPYAVLTGRGNDEEKTLNQVYDKFMNKGLINKEIPKTFEICKYEYKDCATIKKTKSDRIAYVPVECLFTDMEGLYKTNKVTWIDIPVMALIPHIAFFKWMDGQEGFSSDGYLKCCIDAAKLTQTVKITDQWKRNVIKNRADVYYNMNAFLDRDPDFFIRNAPDAEWNMNGYFNLKSGKHRSTFYIAKGKRYIPLKISERDYEAWMNSVQIDNIIKAFKELNIYKVNAPVEHPCFYDFFCENGNFYNKLLCQFIYYLSFKQYEEKGFVKPKEWRTVFVSLNDDGYMARVLQKYGITVEVHNKSAVSKILEDLIIVKNEVIPGAGCGYALIEYNWGKINLADIWKWNMQYLIWLVAAVDIEEFKGKIPSDYLITKCKDVIKDGQPYFICEMEKENAVWK